jgi:hypothetical protein
MNYDHFEREVLGYQADMQCRAERRRMMRGTVVARRELAGASPVRYRLAGALRSLANHLDARPAHL